MSAVVFASSGGGSTTLAAGASTTVNVTTSSTVAGRGTGTLRLALSGISWLYRDYSFKIDEAPETPTAPAVVQKPAGRLDLVLDGVDDGDEPRRLRRVSLLRRRLYEAHSVTADGD